MPARIEYKASVTKDLARLDPRTGIHVLRKIEGTLGGRGREGKGLAGEFAGLFTLRVGDYRVIYARTTEGYLVLRIAHRSDAYRSS